MRQNESESKPVASETLSAYLDGELGPEERAQVERHLAEDANLSAELDAMRRTSRALSEWRVEAPRPNAEFLARLQTPPARVRVVPTRRRVSVPLRRWLLHAAVFLAGALTGGWSMGLVRPVPGPIRESIVFVQEPAAPHPIQIADNLQAISPVQANRLLRKTQAESLKKEVLERIRRDDWREAVSAGKQLWDRYPDTLELDDLRREDARQLLRRKIESTIGRI